MTTYTEKEAREKWCLQMNVLIVAPLIAMASKQGIPIKGNASHIGKCSASDCMAWQWDTPSKFQAIMKHREETGCTLPEAKGYVDREHPELTMEKTHGFCGLCGRG